MGAQLPRRIPIIDAMSQHLTKAERRRQAGAAAVFVLLTCGSASAADPGASEWARARMKARYA